MGWSSGEWVWHFLDKQQTSGQQSIVWSDDLWDEHHIPARFSACRYSQGAGAADGCAATLGRGVRSGGCRGAMAGKTQPGDKLLLFRSRGTIRRRAYDVFNQRNLALVDELCTPAIVNHNASRTIQGIDAYKQFLSMYLAGSPDLHFTIEDQVVEGDKVVTRYTAHGTHLGPFMGVPPTGKYVTATGISIIRVVNGKIVEEWANGDELGILQQLGVNPAQEQSG